jgi:hypothetical protein
LINSDGLLLTQLSAQDFIQYRVEWELLMIKLSRWHVALALLLGAAMAMSAAPANANIRVLPLDGSEYVENLGSNQNDIFKLIIPGPQSAYLDISAFNGSGDTLSVVSCLNGTNCNVTSITSVITSAGGIIPYSTGVWIVMVTLTGTDPPIGFELFSISPDAPLPDPSATPLPAALPLFATGLGALGLLGWRRKRKMQAAA